RTPARRPRWAGACRGVLRGRVQDRLDASQDIVPGKRVGTGDRAALPQGLQVLLSLDRGAGLGVAGKPRLHPGAFLLRQLAIDVSGQPRLAPRSDLFTLCSLVRPHSLVTFSPSSLM